MKNNKLLLRKSAIVWVNEYYDTKDHILLKIFRKDLTESYDVLIDKEDFKKVSHGQWYGYMGRKNTHLKNIIKILYTLETDNKRLAFEIHQWILDTKNREIIIDHINTNRLDNRRCNLRISNPVENAINQIYKGYNYDKLNERYLTRIKCKDKEVNIGRYDTELEAETMYLKAMILLGNDVISEYHKLRIKELNVKLTKEDMNNKYIIKLLNIINKSKNDSLIF